VNGIKMNISILEDFSTWLLKITELIIVRHISAVHTTCCHMLVDA
jgi:hypothetical protein